eukprot:scaffold17867_cov27-Tisochrysis_lutea.AAC.2
MSVPHLSKRARRTIPPSRQRRERAHTRVLPGRDVGRPPRVSVAHVWAVAAVHGLAGLVLRPPTATSTLVRCPSRRPRPRI